MQLNETLMFTDIHWGKKQNSDAHNINCLNFIKFIVSYIKKNKTIDSIAFLGDWFENRAAVNISTMNFAYQGAKLLNELGIPVFFIIGNHDLYTRVHRDIHSVIMYQEFSNFVLIDQPVVIPNAGDGVLMCPYLFHHEYDVLEQYSNIPVFMGHFEFQGFVVTGHNTVMMEGPSHTKLKKQRRIFSGHFHKRQKKDNITYIGNTFSMEYGDANDTERGFAVYNYAKDKTKFVDWDGGPQYVKLTLSKLLSEDIQLPEHGYVKCIADVELNYEEFTKIRKIYTAQHKLKEFVIEEPPTAITISDEDVDNSDMTIGEFEYTSFDANENIISSLMTVSANQIDNNRLVAIYRALGE